MRILFDHCVNIELAAHISGHDIHSAAEMGWAQLENGKLLKAASDAAFDVFLTIDGNLVHQQNLKSIPVRIIVIRAKSNRLVDLLGVVPLLDKALKAARPRQVVELVAPPGANRPRRRPR